MGCAEARAVYSGEKEEVSSHMRYANIDRVGPNVPTVYDITTTILIPPASFVTQQGWLGK